MRKLPFILLCLITTSAFAQWNGVKPMLGEQINWVHPLSKGLVGFWLMNEGSGNKVFDLSGNGNIGDFVDDAHFVAGGFGPAVDFDGTDDAINMGSALAVSLNYPFTFAGWAKPTDSANNQAILMVSEFHRTSHYYGIYYGGSAGQYGVVSRNTSSKVVLSGSLNGKYQHIVGVFASATSRKLYVDGQYLGEETTSVTLASINRTSVGLLYNANSTLWPFEGPIDNAMIWNRVLSASEIALLYREPFVMFVQDDIAMLESGVVPPAPGGGQVIFIQTGLVSILFALILIRRKGDSNGLS